MSSTDDIIWCKDILTFLQNIIIYFLILYILFSSWELFPSACYYTLWQEHFKGAWKHMAKEYSAENGCNEDSSTTNNSE